MPESEAREPEPEKEMAAKKETEFSIPPRLEKKNNCYVVYVETKEDADKIVKGFWAAFGDEQVLEGIDSGMFRTDMEITNGPRTGVYHVAEEYNRYKYFVMMNQNGLPLAKKTEDAILAMWQNLGF